MNVNGPQQSALGFGCCGSGKAQPEQAGFCRTITLLQNEIAKHGYGVGLAAVGGSC